MPTTITLRDLDALNACSDQRALFARTFPDGVTIDVDNAAAVAKAAAEAGLDASWYADRALAAPEWEAYVAAVAPAWAAYAAAVDDAWSTFGAASPPALTAYKAAKAAARIVREAAVAEALCAILASRP